MNWGVRVIRHFETLHKFTLRKTVWGLRLQSLVAVLIVIFVFPSPRPLPWAWDGCDIIESFVFGRHLTHGLTVSAFYGYDRWQLQAIYRTLLVVAPSITGHFTTTATISFGSSPLSAIYMRRESGQQWFRKWLVAYSAPSHYLNQIWVIVNWTLRNTLLWNFNQDTKLFIHENTYENIICEMTAIFQGKMS